MCDHPKVTSNESSAALLEKRAQVRPSIAKDITNKHSTEKPSDSRQQKSPPPTTVGSHKEVVELGRDIQDTLTKEVPSLRWVCNAR